jgi:peptidoglycan/LPS O-acetylase OafA/YrhL
MNDSLSIYFDFVRFFAAVLVVHSHFMGYGIAPEILNFGEKGEFGREAVIIFFVMSGYVIAYTTQEKSHSFKEYFLARSTRIYSVALPVILLSFVIGGLGLLLAPESYADFYQANNPVFYMAFHLAFLGELSIFYEKPFLVIPYWSLSYEVWYYVFFAVVFYSKGNKRIILSIILILLLGHRLLLLLPVWWAGVLLFHINKKHHMQENIALILFVLSIFLIIVLKFSALPEHLRISVRSLNPDFMPSLGSAERFLSDYLYCLLIMLNFYCANSLKNQFLLRYKIIIRNFASYTFTLYLCHMLILEPYKRSFYMQDSWGGFILCVGLVVLFTVLLGEITEKRRYLFRSTLKKIIKP